jgi:small GTP-binding protein
MAGSKRIKIKICLLGDPAVGKTSLVQQFVYNFFSDSYMRTMGTKVSRKVIQVNDHKSDTNYEITMMLWDIMGQQFSSMPMDKYYNMAQGALIVCDLTRRQTFDNLLNWKNSLFDESGEIPIIYLANKNDLTEQSDLLIDEFQEFCYKEGFDFFLTSAKTGENVDAAFERLGELIVTNGERIGVPSRKLVEPQMENIEELIQKTLKIPSSAVTADSKASADIPDISVIQPGSGYIIREEKPQKSIQLFKHFLSEGAKGLCISRIHPNRIEEEFELKDIPLYWLSTEAQSKKDVLAPTFLPQINTIITDFIQKNDNVVILLEGIEYMIEKNDFKTVLNLIHSLNDHIMSSSARLLIPMDPMVLKKQEIHMLKRDLKVI